MSNDNAQNIDKDQNQMNQTANLLSRSKYIGTPSQSFYGSQAIGKQTNFIPDYSIPPKKEAWIERIPVQKSYTDYETRVEYVPVERSYTDYVEVQHEVDYIPQKQYETKIEYVPVERVVEKTEYLPQESAYLTKGTETDLRQSGYVPSQVLRQASLKTASFLPNKVERPLPSSSLVGSSSRYLPTRTYVDDMYASYSPYSSYRYNYSPRGLASSYIADSYDRLSRRRAYSPYANPYQSTYNPYALSYGPSGLGYGYSGPYVSPSRLRSSYLYY